MLIERDPSLRTVLVEGDVIVTNLAECKCFALNGSASAAWKSLETPKTIEQLCGTLVEQFDVTSDKCRSDIELLIGEWQRLGLVRALG